MFCEDGLACTDCEDRGIGGGAEEWPSGLCPSTDTDMLYVVRFGSPSFEVSARTLADKMFYLLAGDTKIPLLQWLECGHILCIHGTALEKNPFEDVDVLLLDLWPKNTDSTSFSPPSSVV